MQFHQKLFFVLQVWTRLLSAANGYQGAEIYRIHLTKQFVDRAAKVKSYGAYDAFHYAFKGQFLSLRLGLNVGEFFQVYFMRK